MSAESAGIKLSKRFFNYIYAKMYRKSIIEQHGIRFIEDVSLGEDTLFVADYISNMVGKIAISRDVLYRYVKYCGGSTLSTRKRKDLYECYCRVNCAIEKMFSICEWDDEKNVREIDRRRIECAGWAIEAECTSKINRASISRVQAVLDSKEFKDALKRNGDLLTKNEKRRYRIQSAVMVLLIIWYEQHIESFKPRRLISKMIPDTIKRLIKRRTK